MNKFDQDTLRIQFEAVDHRVAQMLERKDLPPIVRLRMTSTKISIEKLIQAILDGR